MGATTGAGTGATTGAAAGIGTRVSGSYSALLVSSKPAAVLRRNVQSVGTAS